MLQPGEAAPDFRAKNEKDKWVKLSDFKGKKLVLYFYPKDDTPACTAEACDLRDNHRRFKAKGYRILGVSPDPVKKHARFRLKHQLPFSLLADIDQKICQDYGVWGEKMLYGRKYMGVLRTTFVIDENGIIEDIIRKVETKAHTAQILK